MRSPAVALAWEFGRRHRWGLLAVAGYVLVLVAFRLLSLEIGYVNVDDGSPDMAPRFAATVAVPLTCAFLYCLAVFSFGLSGDLAARQSPYPGRLFTLPVSTGALTGWPMLFGSAAMAGLWLTTARFALLPSGVDAPFIWPAVFAAAFLAWAQALTWMPYGLPGLRVIVAVLWLVMIDIVAMLAIHYRPAELLMVAIFAPQLPLAYLAARAAVGRARRGDVPDWREPFAGFRGIARLLPRRQDRLRSPASAHAWFEWRLHGRSLPAMVGILLPFELALLFVPGTDTPVVVAYTLGGVLLTPPVMAAFAASGVRMVSANAGDAFGMTPFIAIRPLASAALIGAKLRVTLWSTLAAWLLVAIAVPLALGLSGTWPVVSDRARGLSDAIGTPRAVVVALLVFWALMASTWKQLVQRLYIGLSGRGRLIKSGTFLTVSVLIFIEPIAEWVHDSSAARVALWNALPWILAVLVAVKLSAAAWIAPRLQASRLFSDRALVMGAAGWLITVLALYGVLVWLLWSPHIPRYFLMWIAVLAVPLARLSAAPLTLAWNRHR